MASRYRWRQQLLGSLQGQLQLATYLVVFLGFTGASVEYASPTGSLIPIKQKAHLLVPAQGWCS